MRSTLRGIRYFFKSKSSSTRMRADNYTIHTERDWLFFKIKKRVLHASVRLFMQSRLIGIGYFLKVKPRFMYTRADNYTIHAERDWLFFNIKKRVLHASVQVFLRSRLIRIGCFFKLKPRSMLKRADTRKLAGNYTIHAERPDRLFF